MGRGILLGILILFSAELQAQETVTFKVRQVKYTRMGSTSSTARPPASKALTVNRLLKYIPAQSLNRSLIGGYCEIISCRMTLIDPSNNSTVIIIEQTPALELINRFLDLAEGTSVKVDQIRAVDAVGIAHDLPTLRFTDVNARGLARLEALRKKIMG